MKLLAGLAGAVLTDRCGRCCGPAFVEPVAQFQRDGQTRCVYQCPVCGTSWWTAYATEYLGERVAR